MVGASRFGGLLSGLVATALSIPAIAYLDLEPLHSFWVARVDDRLKLATFAATSCLIAYLSGRLLSALQRMARSSDELRLLVEGVKEHAIFMIDPEGIVVNWNPGAERVKGWRSDEIIGKSFSTFYPPEDVAQGKPRLELQRAAEAGYYEDEGWRLRRDGSRFWANVAFTPLRGDRGVLTGFVKVVRDMTRRMMEEERFRLVVEAAPSGMVMADQDGRIVLANRHTEMIFGYSKRELLGKTIELLVPPRYRQAHVGHREGYVKDPAARPMGSGRDLRGLRKDGSEVPVEVALTPLRAADGLYVLASIVDISSRKSAEEDMRRMNESLQQRLADIEEFSYTVSHDLRAPLRAIEGFVQLVKRKASERLRDDEQKLLDMAAASALNMNRLTQDVLLYSRLGSQPLDLSEVNLDRLLDELATRYTTFKDAELVVDRPLGCVLGQASLLTQILANLIANAIKFVADGTKPVIEISTKRSDDRVRLSVKDNGIGIDPKFHDKIFRPFERVPGTTTEGTGIGLAIARKAAARLGGTVGVESKPGEGSRFWVDLKGI